MTGRTAMAADKGPGEAAERASRARWMRLLGMSLAVGLVSGALIAVSTIDGDPAPAEALPVWVAAALTVGWLAVMIYGAWYYETQVDEVERNANYYGYAIGGGLVVLLYPVWYAFWWAGLVREPMHEVLMGLLMVGAVAGYLWKKYR